MKHLRKLLQAATNKESIWPHGKRDSSTAQFLDAAHELLDVVDAAARFIETDLIADHFNLVDTVAALDKKLEGL